MLHSILHLLRTTVLVLLTLAVLAGAAPLRPELLEPDAVDWPTPAELAVAPGPATLGYRPALRDRYGTWEAYRGDGSCSLPWPGRAPFGLEAACQVHDLAYDQLRVAHQRGSGTHVQRMAARLHADLAFIGRSHAECAEQPLLPGLACRAVANTFGAGVLVNSARQGFANAPPEAPAQLGLWWLFLLIALGGVPALRRWSCAVGKHEREFLGQVLPRAGVHRIYIGVRHGWRRRARLTALTAELDSAGALEGGTVCLVVTTGSGWVNPHALATLAEVCDGPLTVAAVQYSRLPSWAVLLLRPGLPARTASAAISAVTDRRDAVAAGRGQARASTLVVHGESLGAGGIAAAARRAPARFVRLDGGLLVSPPGSVEQRPPDGMVLVRHGDDAVVWCTPALLWRPVRWRSTHVEEGDVTPPWRRWRPVATFLSVVRALPAAGNHPFGHGHRYGPELSAGWTRVLSAPTPLEGEKGLPVPRSGAAQ